LNNEEVKIFEVRHCKKLNVRAMPSIKAEVKTIINKYEEVIVGSESNGWSKIETGDEVNGYVMSKYLEGK